MLTHSKDSYAKNETWNIISSSNVTAETSDNNLKDSEKEIRIDHYLLLKKSGKKSFLFKVL